MVDKSSFLRLVESGVTCKSVDDGKFMHDWKKTSVCVVDRSGGVEARFREGTSVVDINISV